MHHMLREILEQPEAVQRLIEGQATAAAEVARLASANGIEQIALVARGTSDHAQTRLPICAAYGLEAGSTCLHGRFPAGSRRLHGTGSH